MNKYEKWLIRRQYINLAFKAGISSISSIKRVVRWYERYNHYGREMTYGS